MPDDAQDADSLQGGEGHDTLWGGGGADSLYGGADNDALSGDYGDQPSNVDGDDYLDGGAGEDTLWGNGGNDTLLGGSEKDYLIGGTGNNSLDGGAGDDYLTALDGDDTYIFAAGYGKDTIEDSGGRNAVRFGAGMTAEGITVNVISLGGSSVLVLGNSTGDVLLVKDYQKWSASTFQFADGSRLTFAELMQKAASPIDEIGSSGTDSLYGSNWGDEISGAEGDDLIVGQGGDDLLNGDVGNDTFSFNIGDGADVVTDFDGRNVVRFGPGIDADSLTFSETYSMDGEHLLRVNYSGGTITIVGGAYGGVSQFSFVDGSSLSLSQVMASFDGISVSLDDQGRNLIGSDGVDTLRGGNGDDSFDAQGGNDLVRGGGGSDTINGGGGNDLINGEAGDDYILGGAGSDTLIGGAGNDTLLGGEGADTFLFQRANGRDQVITLANSTNVLQIDQGLDIQDFTVQRTGNDLVVEHRYSDSAITVKDFYLANTTWQVQHGSQIMDMSEFLAGLSLGQASISSRYEREFQQRFYDAFANSYLSVGFQLDGNGRFYKLYTEDSYSQYKSITEYSSMEFRVGTLDSSLEWLAQADGAVSLDTYENSTVEIVKRDIVNFAAGSGGGGGPTFYRVGVGGFDYQAGSSIAEVRDSQGNVTGWLVYPPSNGGGAGEGARTKSFEYLTREYSTTHKVVYGRDGGETIDVEVGNIFYGGVGNDVISLSTNPYVYEQGAQRFWGGMVSGGAGDDTIRGSRNNDILIGGAGDDLLYGGEGADAYVVEHSGGVDIIVDSALPHYSPNPEVPYPDGTWIVNDWVYEDYESVSSKDVLALPDGVTQGGLQLSWGSILLEGLHVDELKSGKHYLTYEREEAAPLARLLYTTLDIGWGNSQVVRVVMPRAGGLPGTGIELVRFADGTTISLDELIASAGLGRMPDAAIDGVLIDDSTVAALTPLAGGDGNDTLQGNGRLEGWEGNDRLIGGNLNDHLDGGRGSDTLVGGSGSDILGFSREEFFGDGNTYLGGIGNDTIYGSLEADIYRFSRGDGHDVITDLLHLNPDELPDGALPLLNDFDSPPRYKGLDTLVLESGIAPGDVSFAFDGTDLLIFISGYDDSIRFERWADYAVKPLSKIQFQDGTVWDDKRLKQLQPAGESLNLERNIQIKGTTGNDNLAGYESNDYLTAGSGDDYLVGAGGADILIAGTGNDILHGGKGDDELNGGAGSDLYFFARGDGLDVIKEAVTDPLENNILRFADGILHENVEVTRQGKNLILRLEGLQDQIVVNNWFVPSTQHKLSRVEFADGSSWGSAQLESMALKLTGTSGVDDLSGLDSYSDELYGLDGDDLLRGRSGNDTLSGGAGADRLYGDDGDDRLIGGQEADYLDGGFGADTLVGGAGNDTLVIDDIADIVIEVESEGIDTIRSSVTYALSEHVEQLTLVGNGAIDGAGNSLSNVIKGNGAANVLIGGQGNDSLYGGLGDDSYHFARGDGVDRITDDDPTLGNFDRLIFSDVDHDQLWFRVVGDNLEVRVIGTSDRVVVSDWAQGSQHQLEQIVAGDGVALGNAQVANLVDAMAAFAPPSLGQTTLPEHYRSVLDSTLAVNWQ